MRRQVQSVSTCTQSRLSQLEQHENGGGFWRSNLWEERSGLQAAPSVSSYAAFTAAWQRSGVIGLTVCMF